MGIRIGTGTVSPSEANGYSEPFRSEWVEDVHFVIIYCSILRKEAMWMQLFNEQRTLSTLLTR